MSHITILPGVFLYPPLIGWDFEQSPCTVVMLQNPNTKKFKNNIISFLAPIEAHLTLTLSRKNWQYRVSFSVAMLWFSLCKNVMILLIHFKVEVFYNISILHWHYSQSHPMSGVSIKQPVFLYPPFIVCDFEQSSCTVSMLQNPTTNKIQK